MTKAVAGLRSVLVGGMVLALTTVAGCGGEESSSGSAPAPSSTSGSIDRGSSTPSTSSPSLAGNPPATAMAGEAYSFQPKVANASGTMKFAVKNLPSWAVVATGDKAAGSDVVRSMAQRAGATITEVEGSHVIMISQPQAVTDVIRRAVDRVTR